MRQVRTGLLVVLLCAVLGGCSTAARAGSGTGRPDLSGAPTGSAVPPGSTTSRTAPTDTATTSVPAPDIPIGDLPVAPWDAPFSFGPADACDGVPAPEERDRLRGDQTIVAAVVCTGETEWVPGRGIIAFERVEQFPAASLAGLAVAIRTPGVGCAASEPDFPELVLTLDDGSRIRPLVPDCATQPLVDAFAAARPLHSRTPIARWASPEMVRAGCAGESSLPAAGNGPLGEPTGIPAPTSGSFGVCSYDLHGVLTGVGVVTSTELQAIWPTPGRSVSAQCPPAGAPGGAFAVSWVEIRTLPAATAAPATTSDWLQGERLLVAETEICHRVAVGGPETVGYLTASQAAALDDLAATPPWRVPGGCRTGLRGAHGVGVGSAAWCASAEACSSLAAATESDTRLAPPSRGVVLPVDPSGRGSVPGSPPSSSHKDS
ncbi:hypothetical protein GIS00_24595 [Nakamurella sp. YIM 132087]|uniref:Uncharacterized protein n=1 Tax=Nakamurella alba TaxID=2665158 RepID=A0A7K1FSR8_9ACTN|nr:hypothetical protein [Nakamurella alba]MTD17120.1 hypothetical protein [Nakamurella alba]